jgi:transcriptional regulator with XRE-family HTH domain
VPRFDQETVKRIRAAAAYGPESWSGLAELLDVSRSTLTRRLKDDRPEYEQRAFLATVANKTNLPLEFFTADFALLQNADGLAPAILDRLRAIERRLGPDYGGLDEASRTLEDLAGRPGSPGAAGAGTPAPAASPDPPHRVPSRGIRSGG